MDLDARGWSVSRASIRSFFVRAGRYVGLFYEILPTSGRVTDAFVVHRFCCLAQWECGNITFVIVTFSFIQEDMKNVEVDSRKLLLVVRCVLVRLRFRGEGWGLGNTG